MLVQINAVGNYKILGRTRDDAAGEALDKTARMLGLPYPGGPEIEKMSSGGNPARYDFPRSRLADSPFDFSFSGLKTSVLYELPKLDLTQPQVMADVCASVLEAVVGVLVEKSVQAAGHFNLRTLAVSGGVSCNKRLRQALTSACDKKGLRLLLAPPSLCTDNAGMVAFAAAQRFAAGHTSPLEQEVDPNWRIDS